MQFKGSMMTLRYLGKNDDDWKWKQSDHVSDLHVLLRSQPYPPPFTQCSSLRTASASCPWTRIPCRPLPPRSSMCSSTPEGQILMDCNDIVRTHGGAVAQGLPCGGRGHACALYNVAGSYGCEPKQCLGRGSDLCFTATGLVTIFESTRDRHVDQISCY